MIRNYHFWCEFCAKGSVSFETFYVRLNSGVGLWKKQKETKAVHFTDNDFLSYMMAHTEHVKSS